MFGKRSERGFSLIELLTVIAIIAILASIIFPVMNSVKAKANQTKCMSNMMQIAKAIKMYKLDNRKFPDRLGPFFNSSNPVNFDAYAGKPSDGCIMGEYVKTAAGFRCPNSKNSDYSATIQANDPQGNNIPEPFYLVDDYDIYAPGGSNPVVRYTTSWAEKNANGGTITFPPNDNGGTCAPDPQHTSDPDADFDDYKRQLKWRNPPEDTVVTWCSYHNSGNKDVVLFLDGTVRLVDANVMKDSKWRVRPPQL